MLNCKEVTQLCSRELDGRLSVGERVALRMHLLMCTGCGHFREQMQFIRDAARRYVRGDAPPPEEGE